MYELKKVRRTLTHNGQTKTYREWSKETGISVECIRSRKDNGWTDEETLTTPVRKKVFESKPQRHKVIFLSNKEGLTPI